MILATFWENPAAVGLIVAIPSVAIAYLAYRRSRKIDTVAEQAGIASTQSASIGQVVDGLNKIIANLQDDNKVLREDIAHVRESVESCQARIDSVESGNTDLRAQNRELEREVKVLHAENEALKLENQDLRARIAVLEKQNGQ